MGEVEKAVALLLNPTASQDLKQQALTYLQTVKQDPSFYQSAMHALCQMTSSPPSLPLAFFHLQSLEEFVQGKYSALTSAARREMHGFLEGLAGAGESLLSLDISLLNKFSLVYAKVLMLDFPQVWTTGLDTLLRLYPTSRVYRMLLLSVMQMIHEEAIDDETRSPTVDFARAKQLRVVIKEFALPKAMPLWREELERETDLTSATLTVCSRYIGLMGPEEALGLLPLLVRLLGTYQLQVLSCVQSLIRKAMPTEQKLALLGSLRILPYLQSIDFKSIDTEDSDLLKSLAMVTNALGVQLLDYRDRASLWQALDIALRIFASSQPFISRVVFEFFRGFTHALKIKGDLTPPEELTEEEKTGVGRMCLALMERAQIPAGYSFRGPSNTDEEDQFYQFRDDLSELFKELLRLEATKGPVLALLWDRLSTVLPLPSPPAEVLEVLLFLLYLYSDCLTDLHQVLTCESPFAQVLGLVLTSRFPESQLVLRTLFDLCVRVASFFDTPSTEALLEAVIVPMLGMMRSENTEYSSFAVKRVVGFVIRAQKPVLRYAEAVFEASKAVITQNSLDPASLSKLFRAIGLLLGNPGLPDTVKYAQIQHFSKLLLVNCTSAKLQQLSELLSGIGRRGNCDFQANLLSLFLYIAEQLTSMPLAPESYEAVASLTHRFSICLEGSAEEAVARVLAHMGTHVTADTLDCVMKLVSNLAQTCLSAIRPALLSNITQLLVQSAPAPKETISDYSQDLIQHRRNYVKMLEAVSSKHWDLTQLECFPALLDYLHSIVVNHCELIVSARQSRKIAVVVFAKMMHVVAVTGQAGNLGLIVDRALEAGGIVLFSPAMRSITGETTFVLQEICNIHRLAYHLSSLTDQQASFLTYLSGVITPDFHAEYVQLLRVTDQYKVGDAACVSQVNGQLNLMKNLLIRMLEVAPR